MVVQTPIGTIIASRGNMVIIADTINNQSEFAVTNSKRKIMDTKQWPATVAVLSMAKIVATAQPAVNMSGCKY